MHKEIKQVDITDIPDLLRLAEDVRESRQPRLLKRGQEEIALLSPVEAQPKAVRPTRRQGRTAQSNDWLLRLAEITADVPLPADGATDVSANKFKYLAEAYADLHLPKEK
jgi:hypothetical protein